MNGEPLTDPRTFERSGVVAPGDRKSPLLPIPRAISAAWWPRISFAETPDPDARLGGFAAYPYAHIDPQAVSAVAELDTRSDFAAISLFPARGHCACSIAFWSPAPRAPSSMSSAAQWRPRRTASPSALSRSCTASRPYGRPYCSNAGGTAAGRDFVDFHHRGRPQTALGGRSPSTVSAMSRGIS